MHYGFRKCQLLMQVRFLRKHMCRRCWAMMHFQSWPQITPLGALKLRWPSELSYIAGRELCLQTPALTTQTQAALGKGRDLGLGNFSGLGWSAISGHPAEFSVARLSKSFQPARGIGKGSEEDKGYIIKVNFTFYCYFCHYLNKSKSCHNQLSKCKF